MSKLVEKWLTCRIMIKDIFTFLGLDYRHDLLVTFYIVVLGISIPKIKTIEYYYNA